MPRPLAAPPAEAAVELLAAASRQEKSGRHAVLAGDLPSIITDVRATPLAAEMPVTQIAQIGAYASVPLRFSDGTFYGTLCAASHAAKPDLGYRGGSVSTRGARSFADLRRGG